MYKKAGKKTDIQLISQIIGFIAIAESLFIFISVKRGRILILKLISDALWVVSYALIGAYTGAVINGIGIMRESVFYNREKHKWADSPVWLGVFLAVTAGSCFFTWAGPVSILPTLGSMIMVVGLFLKKPFLTRIISLFANSLWLVYGILIGSISSTVGAIVLIISAGIGTLHELSQKRKQTNNIRKDSAMPTISKIKSSIIELGLPDETVSHFDFCGQDSDTEAIIRLINQMDSLLTREQCLSVMEKQGCCKSGKRYRDCRVFAKVNAEKTLEEKVAQISAVQYMMAPVLNGDGTLTVTMKGCQNGVHHGSTTCSCGQIKKLKQPFSVSPTYCGCCAGHFMYHYQNALGVKLRLKQINSSPLNTECTSPCSFTFEIIG